MRKRRAPRLEATRSRPQGMEFRLWPRDSFPAREGQSVMSTGVRPLASITWRFGLTKAEDIARFCCEHLGMHVIEKTDAFTLVA